MSIINKLTFIDSFQFLSSSLHILTQNLAKDSSNILVKSLLVRY